MRFRAFVQLVLAASVACAAVALGPAGPASAGAGGSDPGFGEGGVVTTTFPNVATSGTAVVVQKDGKIVVAGTTDSHALALARYNPNGSLDERFGSNGLVVSAVPGGADPSDVALAADGRILVAATALNPRAFLVARFQPNGAPDTTFGASGMVTTKVGQTDTAEALAVQRDGRVLAVGTSFIDGDDDFVMVRYLPSGALDTGFSRKGIGGTFFGDNGVAEDSAADVGLQSDGKIVVAGTSDTNLAVARFYTDGVLDHSFGAGGHITTSFSQGDAVGRSVDVHAHKVLVGGWVQSGKAGSSTFHQDFVLARYTPAGVPDRTLSGDGKVVTDLGGLDGVTSVAVQGNGRIVAAGFSSTGAGPALALARYDPNGAPDRSFGRRGSLVLRTLPRANDAQDVALQGDGKIVTAGVYQPDVSGDNLPRFMVARFLGARYQPDVMIATGAGTGYKGANRYDGQGIGETVSVKAPRGGTHTFLIRIQNDGSVADTFMVDSARNVKGFTVTYRSRGTDVTNRIMAGRYRVRRLRPGRSIRIEAVVAVWGNQVVGESHRWRLSAVSPTDLTTADSVRFGVTVSR